MIFGMAREYRRKSKRARRSPGPAGVLKRSVRGQSLAEFSFGIIVAVLLWLGMIEVFIWVGADQVRRFTRHDLVLMENCTFDGTCPLRQVRPTFYTTDGFRDSVRSDIFGNVKIRFNMYTH